jgi:hypothetical protein
MQPTDHTSTGVEYCLAPKRISGALYHSVTTYKTTFCSDYNENKYEKEGANQLVDIII